MSLWIRGGRILDPGSGLDAVGDLRLQNGRIAQVHPGGGPPAADGEEEVRADGLWVMPGLIDVHARVGEPGAEEREDFLSLDQAALRGGYTSLLVMPDTEPPRDDAAGVEYFWARAKERRCRMYPAAALTPGRSGRGLVEMAELAEAGVTAFGDCRPAGASAELRWAFEYARPFGLPILAHPLEASLAEEGVMHEGEWSTRLGLPGIPAFAEEIELHRVIRLAAAAGARLHVQQVASEGAAELLRRAKEQGAAVSAEVSPHHLALTDEDLAAYDTALKVEPPLRSRQDREALIEALEEGVIDCIAAAHTPWTPEEKEAEFTHAPYGAAGLETSLAAVLTELVHTGRMTPLTVCERLTTGPARLFGIEGGTLSPGAPADLILVDPHAAWTVDPGRFASKARSSPFAGRSLKGRVVRTIVGGETAWQAEEADER